MDQHCQLDEAKRPYQDMEEVRRQHIKYWIDTVGFFKMTKLRFRGDDVEPEEGDPI